MPSPAASPRTLSAVLFDMDGTLVDSTAHIERHWGRFAARHGIAPETFLGRVHGVRASDMIAEIAPWLDASAESALLDADEASGGDGVIAMEGAAELLASLREGSWALVTSANRAFAAERLTGVGLPVPDVVVGADDVTDGKPAPEAFLTAAARLGAAPADCLVVEDAPAGIAAGLAAGMVVVGISSSVKETQLGGAHACIDRLAELPAALERLGWRLPTR